MLSAFRSIPCRALLTTACVVVALAWWSGLPASLAQPNGKEPPDKVKEQRVKDLQELQRVFGENEVTVFSTGQGAVEGVRIAGVVEVFGRRFLHVRAANGRSVLVLAEAITAIRQD